MRHTLYLFSCFLAFAGVGIFSGIAPAFIIILTTAIAWLLATIIFHSVLPKAFLFVLGCVLIGYAFLGRGFAYCGIPPFFIGEATLALGVTAFIAAFDFRIFKLRITWAVVAFMTLGAMSTIPHISRYGIDSLRDAATWGYAVFAILTATFLLQFNAIIKTIRLYQRWVPWFLIWAPIAMLIYRLAPDLIPSWPVSAVPVISPRAGEMAVHLAGVMVFMALGLQHIRWGSSHSDKNGILPLKEWAWWCIWLAGCVTIIVSRAAILTIFSAALFILLIRPFPSPRWGKPLLWVTLVAIVFFAADIEFTFGKNKRPISPAAVIQTVQSIFFETGIHYYDGTRRWRMEWWRKIVDYTVFGEYFWMGKGYGINLADDDGFQVMADAKQPLRSPHNSHLTFLARGGVPGFAMWIILQVMFGYGMFRGYRRAKAGGNQDWALLHLWVMAYWFAFMVNAAFDVFLEGPQGGIWFWCVFGFGLAIMGGEDRIQETEFRRQKLGGD